MARLASSTMLTQAHLQEVLSYDQETGMFTWLVATAQRVEIGDIAGCINGKGYRMVKIGGRQYLAHRLAWLWITGAWPAGQIDHWNLNRADNRWTNLREASNSQNAANTRRRANNKSGVKGVTFDKRRGKWLAQIMVSGKGIFLGRRDTSEEAAELYVEAAERYYGEFARAA